MMLKLTTMNLKGFLTQLRRMYEQDGSLTLELNVSSPKDYMRLACFAIGDC